MALSPTCPLLYRKDPTEIKRGARSGFVFIVFQSCTIFDKNSWHDIAELCSTSVLLLNYNFPNCYPLPPYQYCSYYDDKVMMCSTTNLTNHLHRLYTTLKGERGGREGEREGAGGATAKRLECASILATIVVINLINFMVRYLQITRVWLISKTFNQEIC